MKTPTLPPPRIHSSAIVEAGVEIGVGTTVWDAAHIRGPARVGQKCIIGEKTYIAYRVSIGDLVKINAQTYICTGVCIEDRVMLAAGVIFTNDRYPRACLKDSDELVPSGPTPDTLSTVVRKGATIGAGAVIGPGLEIGRYAMVGMGAVVLSNVPPYGLVYGNPARLHGYVCVCGMPISPPAARPSNKCNRCEQAFEFTGGSFVCNDTPWVPFLP